MELLEAGAAAPDFELALLGGGAATKQSLLGDGKPVLLAFFKVSCPVCQMSFPFLERLAASDRVKILGVSQDHAGATESFRSRFGVTFPALLDEEAKGYAASNAYGISHVPTMFLLEPSGEIGAVTEGFSKAFFLELGERAGIAPFQSGEYVPEWKAG